MMAKNDRYMTVSHISVGNDRMLLTDCDGTGGSLAVIGFDFNLAGAFFECLDGTSTGGSGLNGSNAGVG